MGGTSFLRVPTLRATGTRTGAVLNDSPVGCQSRDLAPPAGGVESPKTNISANSGNRYCLMGGTSQLVEKLFFEYFFGCCARSIVSGKAVVSFGSTETERLGRGSAPSIPAIF